MESKIPKPLITFEMANNHMGNVDHGIKIIREFSKIRQEYPQFAFSFKLQYRDLDTFIHPSMQGRDDIKYIKRFSETKLSRKQFDLLISEIKACGFLTMATPFDEPSVTVIEDQDLDIIKVASCSFNDWPLLERLAQTKKPIIISTAGATVDSLDTVISFLSHRNKDFAILHCIAEYPVADEKMHVGQIDFFRHRYPGIRIGFSTHENPSNTDIVKLAVAKGADIFEKHVGLPTDQYGLNDYSASPDQVRQWLNAAIYAMSVCGVSTHRAPENKAEQASLRSLRRGVFAKRDIQVGETLTNADVYFAFPPEEDQITANDWGKYNTLKASHPINKDASIKPSNTSRHDVREKVLAIASKVKNLLIESQIVVPGGVDLEISHHFGIDKFYDVGLTLITVVNRGYCKKLLVSLPNQFHPEQYHLKKEETFHVLYGEVELALDGKSQTYKPGDVINIEPGVRHSFVSKTGCVIEEISSTHFVNDSFYTDDSINQNKNRKTLLTYWME